MATCPACGSENRLAEQCRGQLVACSVCDGGFVPGVGHQADPRGPARRAPAAWGGGQDAVMTAVLASAVTLLGLAAAALVLLADTGGSPFGRTRESLFAVGVALVLVGVGVEMLGWLCFRKPGVPFWTFAPVWEVGKYLQPIGVALYIGGGPLGLIGAILLLLYYLT
jgi:hypothetical protein